MPEPPPTVGRLCAISGTLVALSGAVVALVAVGAGGSSGSGVLLGVIGGLAVLLIAIGAVIGLMLRPRAPRR